MRHHVLFLVLGCLALPSLPAWAGDKASEPVPPAPAETPASYDALFSEILQNLPERNRAKVDSARAHAGLPAAPEAGEASMPGAGEKERLEKRGKALEKLSPEVKARVEKAIESMENRHRDRELEFKELKK